MHMPLIPLPFFHKAKSLGASLTEFKAMSNGDINAFLQTMVEAKSAIDAIPALRSEVEHLRRQTHIQGETIANRELHIHNLKQNVTELTQKLRSVEAERDDAGFRALEEADRVQALLTHLQQFVSDSLKTMAAVKGTGPQVVVDEKIVSELAAKQGEVATLSNELDEVKSHRTSILLRADVLERERDEAREEASLLRDRLSLQPPTPPEIDWSTAPAARPDQNWTQVSVGESTTASGLDHTQAAGAQGEREPNPTGVGSDASAAAVSEAQSSHVGAALAEETPPPANPFAASSHGDQSPGVGGDAQRGASSKETHSEGEDLWAIPSRASHYS